MVTLLLSAIIGCWYAYQQNKSAKRHLRRMAKDMEGLQKAENALVDMQKVSEHSALHFHIIQRTKSFMCRIGIRTSSIRTRKRGD